MHCVLHAWLMLVLCCLALRACCCWCDRVGCAWCGHGTAGCWQVLPAVQAQVLYCCALLHQSMSAAGMAWGCMPVPVMCCSRCTVLS